MKKKITARNLLYLRAWLNLTICTLFLIIIARTLGELILTYSLNIMAWFIEFYKRDRGLKKYEMSIKL